MCLGLVSSLCGDSLGENDRKARELTYRVLEHLGKREVGGASQEKIMEIGNERCVIVALTAKRVEWRREATRELDASMDPALCTYFCVW